MSIRKLGLTSTVAILSATSVLGGCNLFESKSQEQIKASTEYRKNQTAHNKAYAEFNKTRDALNKAVGLTP